MLDFSKTEEIVNSNNKFVATGIHDLLVGKIFYQPIGKSVNNETKNDGSLIDFTLPQLRIELTCTNTHVGTNSMGGNTVIGILEPIKNDPDKAQKQMNRILHILSNMSSSENKEKTKASIQNIKAKDFEELAHKLKSLSGRSVRYKFIADQEGKFSQLPNYYGGFAEPADIPFEKSSLKYDEAKEGVKKKDASKVERTQVPAEDLFATESHTPFDDSDELPF